MKRSIGLLVLTFALCLSLPAVTEAASSLPAGFIALAPGKMNLKNAKAYCASKGGRLPFIGGKNSCSSVPKGTPIDGLGAMGAKWPSGLPRDYYWTGTADSTYPWIVYADEGSVGASVPDGVENLTYRVVCVP